MNTEIEPIQAIQVKAELVDSLPTLQTLAERIRYARKNLKMTMTQASKQVGINVATWSNLESGVTKQTSVLNEMAQVLKVDAEWLLLGKPMRTVN